MLPDYEWMHSATLSRTLMPKLKCTETRLVTVMPNLVHSEILSGRRVGGGGDVGVGDDEASIPQQERIATPFGPCW